ncbi:hypothetical protein SAY87_022129 [Trapa incisa]|uniref:glycerophosphodiester phosphodiesterase n=1 Tax=Trapa incisa TaxID=236973 RepID=A0AAN7PSZ9_9MYRT|nr:hypothetical protein SAY87_022129 [Trapa incisa]
MSSSCAAVFPVLLVFSSIIALSSAQWLTLSGKEPVVIARAGFSGMYPDSSILAYKEALNTSVPDVVVWCDVQLTKDGAGICHPYLWLQNSTDITQLFPDRGNTYVVNGMNMIGWFTIDFTLNDLKSVRLYRVIESRSPRFDGVYPVLTVQEMVQQVKPPGLWLNMEHDQFFSQHNLSMTGFINSTSRNVSISYISSPEVNFLTNISPQFNGTQTKLIFRFLEQDAVEPSTGQTYTNLLKNLTFIKTFASGILVPKAYIWPVNSGNYLQPSTSIVLDAHQIGLEIYAADFINDITISYNYSYDPLAEALQYIDNGYFSVDGLLTDFPITPSEAIGCFVQINTGSSRQVTPLVISSNGSSGDYPSCTDLAYTKAIQDGADVIDCPVQMSKDGIPFCFPSINLIEGSTIIQSPFSNRSTTIPELMPGNAIFSFSLTWSEVQSLRPQISNPYPDFELYRNPAAKNAGKFVSLLDFLNLAKNDSSLRVLLRIQNAPYLAKNQGLSVIDAVLDVLSRVGYSNETATKVMIQSTNSSVLIKIKESSNYELVYEIDETIGDALNSTVELIKSFAGAVVVSKNSVLPMNSYFLTARTNTVAKLQAFNLLVYVKVFSNEFVSSALDAYADATVEINTFFKGVGVDGLITDFPKTSARYKKNRCLGLKDPPAYMRPSEPGVLLGRIPPPALPPPQAPLPSLVDSDVAEPPFPAVTASVPPPPPGPGTTATPATPPSGSQPRLSIPGFISNLPVLLASLLLVL